MDLFSLLLSYNFLQWIFQEEFQIGELLVFRHINKNFAKELHPNKIKSSQDLNICLMKQILKLKQFRMFVHMHDKYKYNLPIDFRPSNSSIDLIRNVLFILPSHKEEERLQFEAIQSDLEKVKLMDDLLTIAKYTFTCGNLKVSDFLAKNIKQEKKFFQVLVESCGLSLEEFLWDILAHMNVELSEFFFQHCKSDLVEEKIIEICEDFFTSFQFEIDIDENIEISQIGRGIWNNFFQHSKKKFALFLMKILTFEFNELGWFTTLLEFCLLTEQYDEGLLALERYNKITQSIPLYYQQELLIGKKQFDILKEQKKLSCNEKDFRQRKNYIDFEIWTNNANFVKEKIYEDISTLSPFDREKDFFFMGYVLQKMGNFSEAVEYFDVIRHFDQFKIFYAISCYIIGHRTNCIIAWKELNTQKYKEMYHCDPVFWNFLNLYLLDYDRKIPSKNEIQRNIKYFLNFSIYKNQEGRLFWSVITIFHLASNDLSSAKKTLKNAEKYKIFGEDSKMFYERAKNKFSQLC